jgi:hypothetical protein
MQTVCRSFHAPLRIRREKTHMKKASSKFLKSRDSAPSNRRDIVSAPLRSPPRDSLFDLLLTARAHSTYVAA